MWGGDPYLKVSLPVAPVQRAWGPHTVVMIRVEHEIEINCRGGALFRPLWPVVRALRQRSADSQTPPVHGTRPPGAVPCHSVNGESGPLRITAAVNSLG